MSDRQVKLVRDGKTGEASAVETGIPQRSPAVPIVFVTYLSGIIKEVEPVEPASEDSPLWTTSAGGQRGRMTRQWW